ncbi:MAG: hypothetical protein JNG89_03355 [Planctomycetaceae bacterium]|nr:hypothetical protein [Planctomycetaceae bacterium]
MSPLPAALRAKYWKRWYFVPLVLTVGAVCGLIWQSPAGEFHSGAMTGTQRSGPLWAIHFADWTGIAALQALFVIASEADLSTADCNDDDLKKLEQFRKFNSLSINGASVTDDGLRAFSNVRHLETLQLKDVAISPRGIANLERMTKLKTLKLSGDFVTDAHLRELHDVQTLIQIELLNTNTTNDGRNALAGALPECRITWEPLKLRPTAGE